MHTGFLAWLIAAGAVTLAEMGDKTQLLSMAFATRFGPWKVMAGVLLATLANHGLAVWLGSTISRIPGLSIWIQGLAALSFIFFGLWTLRGEDGEEEEKSNGSFGPVLTVAIAFFVGELGDKTQLTTMALAARFPATPLWVLAGTTTGMLIANGLGIVVGLVLCRRIPERTVRRISAAAFILFGFLATGQMLLVELALVLPLSLLILLVLALITGFTARRFLTTDSAQEPVSELAEAACRLKDPMEATDQ